MAYDATVGLDGGLSVYGLASGVQVDGGFDDVGANGVQSGGTILSGGIAVDKGTEFATTVESGGALYVSASDVDAVVSKGGYMEIDSGGSATGVTVLNGGIELVTPLGSVSGSLQSGSYLINGGGDVSGLVVDGGGIVFSNGFAILDNLNDTVSVGTLTVGKTFSGYGTTEYVLSGGVASQIVLLDNDAAVFSGGVVDGGTVSAGDLKAYVGGTISGMTIASGAYVNNSGASVYEDTVSSGGDLRIHSGSTFGTVLLSGGAEDVDGGTASGTTVYNGGIQNVYSGRSLHTTVSSGGTEIVDSGVASATTIAGGTLSAGNYEGDVYFSGTGGVLSIYLQEGPFTPPFDSPIKDFVHGDTIAFGNSTYSAQDFVSVGDLNNVTIFADGFFYPLDIIGANPTTPLYLAAGTRILTPRGEIPVESLAINDTVITNDGQDAAITWIGHRHLNLMRHPKPETAQPIRIAAHAFADGVPSRDLILSPDHALYLNNVLIPAKALINHRNVHQLTRGTIIYFHIELAEHSIIFAENTAVETYLETGNRAAFENGAGAITLHPDFAQTLREQQSCAPFVTTGPAVDAAAEQLIRQHYAIRAAQ